MDGRSDFTPTFRGLWSFCSCLRPLLRSGATCRVPSTRTAGMMVVQREHRRSVMDLSGPAPPGSFMVITVVGVVSVTQALPIVSMEFMTAHRPGDAAPSLPVP
jgi:hypothetical protein